MALFRCGGSNAGLKINSGYALGGNATAAADTPQALPVSGSGFGYLYTIGVQNLSKITISSVQNVNVIGVKPDGTLVPIDQIGSGTNYDIPTTAYDYLILSSFQSSSYNWTISGT